MADFFDDIDDDAPATFAGGQQYDRKMVPEGVHELRIVQVTDDGGVVKLRLAHHDKSYGFVFQNLPKAAAWSKRLASQLRNALCIPKGEFMNTVAAGDITGRLVNARIYHNERGERVYVNVGEFMPIDELREPVEPAPKAASSAPARTATKKADAVGHDPNDIPF